MTYRESSIKLLEDVRTYNIDVEHKIEIAKVYAILDLAEAIRHK